MARRRRRLRPRYAATALTGLWSDPATWGGALPVAGQDVVIPTGMTITLDVDYSATALGFLTVQSGATLRGVGGTSIGLSTKGNMVMGYFLMGTQASPLAAWNQMLTGIDSVWPAFSSYKSVLNGDTSGGIYRSHMVMSGGVSKVYVAHPSVMRCSLAANASSGATSLTTDVATNWPAGAQFALSPDDYYTGPTTNRTEVHTLSAAHTTSAMSLSTSLGFARFGLMQYPIDVAPGTNAVSLTQGTWTGGVGGTQPASFDERAKLILLSLNGKVQGANDSAWTVNGIGAHTMCMPGGVMYWEGVQFDRCGQDGRVARYPVHFHMLSFTSGSFTQFIAANSNAPTFISTTSFSVAGDQTAKFPNLQQISWTGTNTGKGYVNTAVFSGGITTVVVYQFSPISDTTYQMSGNLTGVTSVQVISGGGAATGFDTSQSGAKFCTVTNSKLRAMVSHGTDGILFQDNNAYNINGAAFFLEDGVENNNTFLRCSVFKTNDPGSGTRFKDFDRYFMGQSESLGQGPAGFWITNMHNTVQDCWAADCQGIGFWNSLARVPFGLSTNVVGRRAQFQQMGSNVHLNNRTWSNASHNLMTRGAVLDDLGNIDAASGYYPTVGGNSPTSHGGGTDPNLVPGFTIEGVISHHCTTIGYSNAVGAAIYKNWAVSNAAEVSFFGAADEHSQMLAGLYAGFTTRTGGATPLNTSQTLHCNASYHRGLNTINNAYVNFPFADRETLTDFGAADNQLYMGSGATRTFDLYEDAIETGSRRDTGNTYTNSHRGFRSQSPNIDGRVMSSDHRWWCVAGVEWDYNNSWGGGSDTYLMADIPFFTYGASGLVDILPTGHHQGKASTSKYFGLIPVSINGGGDVSNRAGTWNQMDATGATSQGSWAYQDNQVGGGGSRFAGNGFHHAAVRDGGFYTFTCPPLAIPSTQFRMLHMAFTNKPGSVVLQIRIDWDGTVPAKVGFKTAQDSFNFATNFHIINGYGSGAGGAYGNVATSLADLLTKTVSSSGSGSGGHGVWMWQDTANNFLYIRCFSNGVNWNTGFSQGDPVGLDKIFLEQAGTLEVSS